MQQRTAEQIVDAPQSPEESVEMVRPVPRERAHEKLGVYFRAWMRVDARLWKAREVRYATETALTVESGRCAKLFQRPFIECFEPQTVQHW